MHLSLRFAVSFQHLCPDLINILLQLDDYALLPLDLSSVLCFWLISIVFEFSQPIFERSDFRTQFFPDRLVVTALGIEPINFSFVVLLDFNIIPLGLGLQLLFKRLILNSEHFILTFQSGDLLLKLLCGNSWLFAFLVLVGVVPIVEPLIIALNEGRSTQK